MSDGKNIVQQTVGARRSDGNVKAEKKRPAETDVAAAEGRLLKRLRQRLTSADMNPVMILNEYRKDVEYQLIEQTGPSHAPSFTFHLIIDDQVYVGTSTTKKKAKLLAAENALQTLACYLPTRAATAPTPDVISNDDKSETENGLNPVVVLNQLRSGVKYELIETTLHDISATDLPVGYQMKCLVDGQCFEGQGSNKKIAKARSAQLALFNLFAIQCTERTDGFPMYTGDSSVLNSFKSKPAADGNQTSDATQPQLVVSLPPGKNPVSLLNELYTDFDLKIDDPHPDQPSVFVARLTVEHQEFMGQARTKKDARMFAAIIAVNYLYTSGLLNMRITEKANKRQSKPSWPRPRAQFSQESAAARSTRGGAIRGKSRADRSQMSYNTLKSSYNTDGNQSSAWVAGGLLTTNDFLGLHHASSSATSNQYSQLAEHARNFAAGKQSTSRYTDDTYGSFQVSDPTYQIQVNSNKTKPSGQFSTYGSYVSGLDTAAAASAMNATTAQTASTNRLLGTSASISKPTATAASWSGAVDYNYTPYMSTTTEPTTTALYATYELPTASSYDAFSYAGLQQYYGQTVDYLQYSSNVDDMTQLYSHF